MSDITSPTTNPQSFHHDEEHEQGHGHAKTPFGMTAACVILAVGCAVLGYTVKERSATASDLRTQLNQASSEVTQLKSDGDKANALAAGLKSQLDASQSQASGLKSQLEQAQVQKSAVQSQLDKAVSERSALQRQLDGDKAQFADVQGQLGQANDKLAALSKERDQARQETADLRSQMEKAQADAAKPQAAAQKDLPVTTEFKKAFFGSSYVLHVTNPGANPIKVSITVSGKEPVPATINGGATFEVKDLPAGANVVIGGEGYNNVYLSAR
jgi:hypothetical protein